MKRELRDALDRLNPAQRAAVEQTEGPVMVVAGPGTGKTQILAARIGYILHSVADVQAENILCLTYTEAGTAAMRKRLFTFVGADAYRVGIYTFHAFCNRIIQDVPERFGMRELEPLSDLEQRQMLRDLVDDFPSGHPLKRYTSYYEVKRLAPLFALMKREDWTAAFLGEKVEAYLDDIRQRPEYRYKKAYREFRKGDLREAAFQEEADRMQALLAGAGEFEPFQERLARAGRYDFADMIRWVLHAFRRDSDLLRDYQERYQYFLVDEYQDTSGAQNEILRLLIDYWDSPNVFVVGDDDQSIFRFQGANIQNITSFASAYARRGLEVVVLRENYRSSQAILDAAGHLIARNQERLVATLGDVDPAFTQANLHKELAAASDEVAGIAEPPAVITWHNDANETVGVAREIERLIRHEGVNGSEIAVIYRNHRQAEDIVRYLEASGIPIEIKRKADVLASAFMGNVIQLLDYLDRESRSPGSGDHLLFEILHFRFFDIRAETTAFLASELRFLQDKRKVKTNWRGHIRDLRRYFRSDLFDTIEANRNEELQKVYRLGILLDQWQDYVFNETLQTLVERLSVESGALGWALQQPDRSLHLQEFGSFFDFVKQETAKRPRMRLSDLLATLRLLRDEGLNLEMQKVVHAPDGVPCMTAHGAKGHEFDYVFLIGCHSKAWDEERRGTAFKLPDTITPGPPGSATEESRRLFYVAMTRARRRLWINYAVRDNAGRMRSESRFVAELRDSGLVELRSEKLESESYEAYWERFVMPADKPDARLIERETVRRMLTEKYQLSVTHLSKYLKCPLSFYYEQVLRIPAAKNANLAFGSAVHDALERLYKDRLDRDADDYAPLDRLVDWFRNSMTRQRDSFTDREFERRLAYGREKVLPAYYEHQLPKWGKVGTAERDLQQVIFDDIPLRGKLDRIDFDGNDARVIDYKTGKLQSAKDRGSFKAPDPNATEEDDFVARYGGDYWRQAVFYKILVDRDRSRSWRVVSTGFDFVQPDPKSGRPSWQEIYVTDEDVAIVGRQIREAWDGIQALDFRRGCGEEDCRWCTFVRDRQLTTADVEEEAEAD